MAEYVVMPKLGFDMREGVLVDWLKKVGDEVSKGDILAEIESDKATLELESQVSGTLLKTLANPGDVVPVGGQLAVVGQQGEDVSALAGDGQAPAEEKPAEKKPEEPAEKMAEAPSNRAQQEQRAGQAPPKEAPLAQDGDQPAEASKAPAAAKGAPADGVAGAEELPGGVKATPVARRLAAEQGVDLG
ncbi:MAG: biotin/lipoyl-containing protein, partial [Candidatus Promineifilaceae bacterium]